MSERMSPLVVSIRTAAQALDVSRDTIERMTARGELEPVRLGPRRRGVTYKSLVALVEAGKTMGR